MCFLAQRPRIKYGFQNSQKLDDFEIGGGGGGRGGCDRLHSVSKCAGFACVVSAYAFFVQCNIFGVCIMNSAFYKKIF